MPTKVAKVSFRGKVRKVPSIEIDGRTIVITGKWIRTAKLLDEEYQERSIGDPENVIRELRRHGIKADILTFAQKLPDMEPHFSYPSAKDSLAVIPITTFDDWRKRISRKVRQDVSRATRMGVTVEEAAFDDELVKGIVGVYNDTPVRQGRRFWNYGKTLETVKQENADFLDRSTFLAAYWQDEMIAFVKIVFLGNIASFLQIISKTKHNDKRPLFALIAKAIAMCEMRRCSFLVYGKYKYGDGKSSLLDFKRRIGFEEMLVPRYFVPLTRKGKLMVKCGFHRGWKRFIPQPVLTLLRALRAKLSSFIHRNLQLGRIVN